jgi:hypothetical protein
VCFAVVFLTAKGAKVLRKGLEGFLLGVLCGYFFFNREGREG